MPKDLSPVGWVVPSCTIRKQFDAVDKALDLWVDMNDLYFKQFRALMNQTKEEILRGQIFVCSTSNKDT
jgi:hypothetical protein